MLNKLISKLTIFALKNKKLSGDEKTECLNALLDNLLALPIYAIIKTDEQNRLIINNVLLDYEKALQLRESAKAALNNQALNLVNEQIAFMAVNLGVHQAFNNEQIVFAKSALWNMQETNKLLKTLAGDEEASHLAG